MKAKALDILRDQGGAQGSRSARQTREAAQAKTAPRNPGGALVKRPTSQPQRTGGPVEQVKVRDLGNTPQRSIGPSSEQKGPTSRSGSPSRPALPSFEPKRPGSTSAPPTRRELAEAKLRQAAQGSKPSGVRTNIPVREATAAATRSGKLVRGARNLAIRGTGPLVAATTAIGTYADARKRGESQGRSAAQGLSGAAGFAAGAKAGAMVPGPPLVKGAGALIGGALGSTGALKAMQGIQEAGKKASGEKAPRPAKPERQGPTVPRRILAAGGGKTNPPKPEASKAAPRPAETRYSGPPRTASQQPTAVVKAPTAAKKPPAKQPDKPSMSGVGPVKDGELYADKLKISKIGDGPDMERRRAFLDAKDSMAGMKAVRDLLEKRKKRMAQG